MTDTYSTPDDLGDIRASELTTSLPDQLGAIAGESAFSGLRTLGEIGNYAQAEGRGTPIGGFAHQEFLARRGIAAPGPEDTTAPPLAPPTSTAVDLTMDEAKARVKAEGLEGRLKLPDQSAIHPGVLNLMLQHAHEQADYEAAVARGPQGFFPSALGFMTQIGAGMIDPVNDAAFAIPVLGEARWGKMLEGAGESVLARAGVRTAQGAAQGAVGGAALAPADWWLKTQDGQDYTYADALKSVVLSAGMGAAFHAGFGAVGDVRARLRGVPLPGSPADLALRGLGTHVPAAALAEEGVPEEGIPGIAATAAIPAMRAPEPPLHPAEVLADLPQAAQEDAVRAAIADVTAGRPVRAAEMLQEAAKEDPRIAESIEAYHGSPHDFERFDINRIGTGEGAQAYGHGLYFAESPEVADAYRLAVTDAHNPVDKQLRRFLTGPDDNGPGQLYPEGLDLHNLVRPGEERATISHDELLKRAHDNLASVQGTKGSLAAQAKARAQATIDYLNANPDARFVGTPYEGRMYRVRINADREHFLDWDKPLSEQSQKVQEAVARAHGAGAYRPLEQDLPRFAGLTGQEAVEGLAQKNLVEKHRGNMPPAGYNAHADASTALREAGLPGIKYLDQGSRGITSARVREQADGTWHILDSDHGIDQGGFASEADARKWLERKQTHNFVVFDDKLIRITHKNGKEVGLDEMKAARTPSGAPIDASHDIVSGANSSREPGGPVYIDRHIPQFSPKLKDKDGNPANLWKYLSVHEETEAKAMARGMSYDDAHTKVATPAERAAVEADGVDWKEYTKEIDGYLDHIEHEHPSNPPPAGSLHVDPRKADEDHHRSSSKQGAAPRRINTSGMTLALPAQARDAFENAEAYKVAAMRRREKSATGGGKVYASQAAMDRARGISADEARAWHAEASTKFDAMLKEHGMAADVPEDVRAAALEAMQRHGFDDDAAGALEYATAKSEREALADEDLQSMLDREELDRFDAGAHVIATEEGHDLHGDIPFGPGEDAAQAGQEAAGQAQEAPGAGRGAREARAGEAGTDRADWDRLRARPDPDPDLAEASAAADATPEPASVDPAKSPTAAEAEAAKADKLLDDILPSLSEEERKQFDDVLAKLDADNAAHEQIIREGAACLAAAVA